MLSVFGDLLTISMLHDDVRQTFRRYAIVEQARDVWVSAAR
jgi:hypothetical protein